LQASEPDGELRFRMLGTVREYALERLEASGEADAIYAALAAQVIDLAEQADPAGLVARLTREQANIRATLAWALGDTGHGGDPATALRLAAALWPFWHMRGQYQEGHGWLERAIAQAGQVDPAARAQAFLTLANIANNLEDHAHARSLYEESLRLSEEIRDERGVAGALIGLGMVATNTGDYDRAEALLERGITVVTGGPSVLPGFYARGQLATARGQLDEAERWFAEARTLAGSESVDVLAYLSMEEARIARYRGDLATAREMASACLGQFREIGERRAEAVTLSELGLIELQRGDLDAAANMLEDAAARHLELRDELNLVRCLEGLAGVAATDGRPQLAGRLAGAATAWRHRVGTVATVPERQALDRAVSAARSSAPDEVEAAWRAGSVMSVEQAFRESTSPWPATYPNRGTPSRHKA
jgi:tetratricopeptide (TPR) repeat protein